MLGAGQAPVRMLNRGASAFDGDSRVEVVRGDVTEPADVDRAVKGCGRIYHLAGLVSRNPADEPSCTGSMCEGTRLAARSRARNGVERVMVASSSGHDRREPRRTRFTPKSPATRTPRPSRWPYYVEQDRRGEAGAGVLRQNKTADRRGEPFAAARARRRARIFHRRHRRLSRRPGALVSLPAGSTFVDARDGAAGRSWPPWSGDGRASDICWAE